jgi:hypothetical protein
LHLEQALTHLLGTLLGWKCDNKQVAHAGVSSFFAD